MVVMKSKLSIALTLSVLGLLLPVLSRAQAEGTDMPLGDLARSLRRKQGLPAHTVIDNDNLSQVVEEVQSRKLNGSAMLFSLDQSGKNFTVSAPDVTCSLSFSGQASSLLSDSFVAQDLPEAELPKLDGPATIKGNTLEVTVYNGTGWNLREITVGLTVVRAPSQSVAKRRSAKLIPAAEVEAVPAAPSEKHSDLTVLYHLKGAAAPSTTTVFYQSLGAALGPDQEWHWAIVQAKGIPPTPAAAPNAAPSN
jgi:hypothetical protein